MNLFQLATAGVDVGALPDQDAPRAPIDFGASAPTQGKFAAPQELEPLFDAAASEYGVDPTILKGIAFAESRFRPDIISGKVTSPAGAVGLMQFMPATAKEMGINPLDPAEAVFGAAAYLRQSLDKFNGDVEKAVASYNFGRNRDLYTRPDWHKGLPAETRNYVGTVLEFADGLSSAVPARDPRVALPEGVMPSQAGGGRGVINPEIGVNNYQEQKALKRDEVAPVDEAVRGVKTGVTGLKQLWESNSVLKDATLAANMQERLSAFDRIDAGAKDVPRAIGLAYQQAGPEERQRLRGVVQKELGQRRDFLDASMATIKQYQADMERTKGRVAEFTDIQGVKDFTNWLAFNGGAGVASMAPLILAAATGPLAPAVAGAVGLGMATGEINSDRIDYARKKGMDNEGVADYVADKAGSTVGAAIPFAAMDVVAGPVGSILSTSAKGGVKALERMGVRQAAKEIAKDTAEEFVTGGAQEAIKLATGYGLDETDALLTAENAKKLLNSAAAEAAGGLTGGGGRVAGVATLQAIAPRVEAQPSTPQAPVVPAGVDRVAPLPTSDAAQTATESVAKTAGVEKPTAENTTTEGVASYVSQPAQPGTETSQAAGTEGAAQSQGVAVEEDAQPASVSELGASPGEVARQLLAQESGPDAPKAEQQPATVEQAEQQLAEREESAKPAPIDMQLRSTGTLLVKGDVPALRARLAAAGVDNTIAVDGGLVVARSQAAKAQEVLSTSTVAQMPTAQPAVDALQEAANVPQAQEPAAQPAAEAAQAAAPDIATTVAPVPAAGVPAAGSAATAQADGVAAGALDQKQSPAWLGSTRLQLPGEYRSAKGLQDSNVATDAALVKNEGVGVDEGKTYSKEMSPELARTLMAMKRPIGMATKGTVRGAANELVNGMGMLPNSLGRVVVATSDEIKTDWEPLIGATGMESSGDVGKAQGFYDPKTKTVFVIADHIRQGDELGVVAHELMHKHGQAVLGQDGWNKLHTVIGTWADADQATMERRVYDEAAARVDASRPEGAPEQQYSSQELFPYAVQAALEAGVKPSLTAQQGTVARWLGQVRTALRQVWGKVTGKPGQFEVQDLVNLAFGIAQRENPTHAGELDGVVQNDGAPQTDSTTDGEMQFSRSPIESSMGEMTPDQLAAWQKAAGLKTPPTLKERAAQMKANLSTKLRQGVVDQFAPIADLDQHAYMLARLSKGADGTMEAALLYGRPFLRDGVPDVDVNEGGFARVLAGLKGEHDRFLWWVAALRAENLKAQGKENLLDTPDIDALKTLNQGQMADGSSREMTYAEGLLELNDFNNAVLQIAKESGLIDQAAVDLFKDQPYVPFYRLQDESGQMPGPRFSAGLTNQQAWKKLKGGTQQINADLLQNMLMNWSSLYQAAARNRAALATMDAAEQLAVAYQVPDGTKGAVKIMRDGVAEHWAVEDPFLLDAISALHYTPSALMKALSKPKQLLTWAVTVNPTFKVRNLIRDSISAIAQADLSYNAPGNVWKGWKLTASDSQVYASMLASGGVIKFGTQENTDRLRNQVAKLGGTLLDDGAAKKMWGMVKAVGETYQEVGDRTENVNRTALYDRLIKKGYSHADASFMARDLMDFSMSGNLPLVRFLTQTVPFLNARLQGLYKLGRAAGEDPARFAAVVTAVSIASLTLLAMYHDDDDWKKREDWDRDAYWWFKIGKFAFRIPKPFEVGALGTLTERTAEMIFSKEMDNKRFFERLRHMLASTFALDPIPQAIKPLLDVSANKDSFTGRAIETQTDQKLRPKDRYSERTPEIARLLGSWGLPDPLRLVKGEWAGLSPKQVEHLMRGYFSWVATVTFTVTDAGARAFMDKGDKPAMRLKDVFMAGNFIETLPSGSSRYVTKMYEQSKEAGQAYASYQAAVKAGDKDRVAEIRAKDLDKLKSHEQLQDGMKALARINAYARMVEADKKMTAEQKRDRLETLEQQRHKIASTVVGAPKK